MVALNTEDIKSSIGSFKTDYVLMDTPGQLELFVFREAGKYIAKFLNPDRSVVAYLLDPALAKTASGFVSQLLLSINTSFRLGLPQINILSKADMLPAEELDIIKRWADSPEELEQSVNGEDASMHREISEKILNLLKDFEGHTKLFPAGKEEFFGVEDLYSAVQLLFEGGEDILKD